ncbi:MAG TPA: DUF3887 domain-containing protein [Candidatus Limnocylindria bacterium]
MSSNVRLISTALVVVITIAACSSPATSSPVSEREARVMAEEMLMAYNDGDYGAWSAAWSTQMKDAIDDAAFAAFREQTMAVAGAYQAIESVESRPGNNAGVWRWEFIARFENGRYVFMIAFNEGSPLIEGVNLQPTA